jgi:hypothetical protein
MPKHIRSLDVTAGTNFAQHIRTTDASQPYVSHAQRIEQPQLAFPNLQHIRYQDPMNSAGQMIPGLTTGHIRTEGTPNPALHAQHIRTSTMTDEEKKKKMRRNVLIIIIILIAIGAIYLNHKKGGKVGTNPKQHLQYFFF